MAYENILAQKVISREILQLKLFPIYHSMHHYSHTQQAIICEWLLYAGVWSATRLAYSQIVFYCSHQKL